MEVTELSNNTKREGSYGLGSFVSVPSGALWGRFGQSHVVGTAKLHDPSGSCYRLSEERGLKGNSRFSCRSGSGFSIHGGSRRRTEWGYKDEQPWISA
ncbi:hypothetical protein NL676_034434 [Syzygium grande]|nr:hypothetical protein NL676_034434 [Syzygium grande]